MTKYGGDTEYKSEAHYASSHGQSNKEKSIASEKDIKSSIGG
jgi:hypothetical protein